jgi:hypothetical protein
MVSEFIRLRDKFSKLRAEAKLNAAAQKCKHLGEATGTTVKVACVGCKSCRNPGKVVFVNYPSFKCEVFNRCLPDFHPGQIDLVKWDKRKPESELYHLCDGCTERVL